MVWANVRRALAHTIPQIRRAPQARGSKYANFRYTLSKNSI